MFFLRPKLCVQFSIFTNLHRSCEIWLKFREHFHVLGSHGLKKYGPGFLGGGSPELVQTKTHTSRKYKKNLYSKVLSKLKIVILSSPHHLIFVVFVCQ